MPKDQYIDLWKDIEGKPTHCKEELYLCSQLENTVIPFAFDTVGEPYISVTVEKGSMAQAYAQSFIDGLKNYLNRKGER